MRFVSIFKRPRGETLPGALPALFALLLMVWAGLPARAAGPGTQYLVKSDPYWTAGGSTYTGYWDYSPVELVDVNHTLYFCGWDSVHGSEVWRSDGTAAGTYRFTEVVPQNYNGALGRLTNVNGTLFFFAKGRTLWKSDGTSNGTVLLKDFSGSTTGKDNYYDYIVPFQGTAYFLLNQTDGAKLWKSDGTTSGTQPLKVIDAKNELYAFYGFLEHKGRLYFSGWKTDGSAEGTVPCNGLGQMGLTGLGDNLLYLARDSSNQYGLWKSDGGISTPTLLRAGFKEIDYLVKKMPVMGDSIYFPADDGAHGLELWKCNGTAGGTLMVRDLLSGASGATPRNLTVCGGQLFFSVHSSDGHGVGLWKTDGTAAGTVLVREFTPAPRPLSDPVEPYNFMDVNGVLYFVADDGVSGVRLWKSDGTSAGTVRVPSSVPDAEGGAYPACLTLCGDRLFFRAKCAAQYGVSGSWGIWAINLKAPNAARNWMDYQ